MLLPVHYSALLHSHSNLIPFMLCEIWEQDAYSRGISIDWGSIATTCDSVLFVAQLDVLILELYFWRHLMIY